MGKVLPFQIVRLCFVCGDETTIDALVEIAFCNDCRREPWLDHLLRHAAVGEMVLGSPAGTQFEKKSNNEGDTHWEVTLEDIKAGDTNLETALMTVFEGVV